MSRTAVTADQAASQSAQRRPMPVQVPLSVSLRMSGGERRRSLL